MCSKRTLALPEVQEEDDEDAASGSQQSQFQVQIIVTPIQGCDGGAEIRVMGGTPRATTKKLPPIHTHGNSRRSSLESPSAYSICNSVESRSNNFIDFNRTKSKTYSKQNNEFIVITVIFLLLLIALPYSWLHNLIHFF
ncbi:hypothetical protein TcasGA2_TC032580 [Tribolium castaneum]|uniref:Uncharacterized protein n=1 Tax=Tribolium castaneum TaxID=7070 RepID=A0A139WKG2_TRICA|nr:hypothetical protein TcasGA2_TC032580 [Tribolium castaneum]